MQSNAARLENHSSPVVLPEPNNPVCSECLASALELLEVLKEEAQILRRFAGDELLALIPKKEYLVHELEWKLQSARQAGAATFMASDSFKALIEEISRLNTSNGVFIEKSLSYWHGLLSIFSPPAYGPAGKVSGRLPRSPKGTTFRQEI